MAVTTRQSLAFIDCKELELPDRNGLGVSDAFIENLAGRIRLWGVPYPVVVNKTTMKAVKYGHIIHAARLAVQLDAEHEPVLVPVRFI